MVAVIRFFFWIMFFVENIGIKANESQFEKIGTCIFFAIIKVKTGPTDPSNLQGLIHLYFFLELYCIFNAFAVEMWLICLFLLIQVTTSAFCYPLSHVFPEMFFILMKCDITASWEAHLCMMARLHCKLETSCNFRHGNVQTVCLSALCLKLLLLNLT